MNPIPASSGDTNRHRLNRGGDRRLNKALRYIAITRMTYDAGTKAYLGKRIAEGLTRREVRRCIKRYLARRLYRTLNALYDQHGGKITEPRNEAPSAQSDRLPDDVRYA